MDGVRCELVTTEYRKQFTQKRLEPVEKILQRDDFSESIEEGQLDPRIASIPQKLDEAAERIVNKRIQDIQRSVYQVHYKHPWQTATMDEGDTQSEDFESALLSYINKLYCNQHTEKVLAPPATSKRIYGYPSPKLLHGSLSNYQDCYGRVGGNIMLKYSNMKSLPGNQK